MFRSRRIRKVLGGSMRQTGIVAAAGVYALDNCVERLADDHKRAKKIGYGIVKFYIKLISYNLNHKPNQYNRFSSSVKKSMIIRFLYPVPARYE